ncbi:MAG: 50S ribosomal protein L15 [Candidatus Omnitrophica bacterium ADurb.Bin205]|nr:MAG: 50S ribosomal protein L15 [Candidatus Omnitrophica bacterium ADurb.Bin205]
MKNKTVKEKKEEVLKRVGLFNLSLPKGAHKKRKYLGRGSSSGHGKTSTRGSKGQTSRAGRHFYLGFEGGQSPLIRKMPKRGFISIFKKSFQIVTLESIAKIKDATVDPALLKAKGMIKDKEKPVKILGNKDLKAAVTVKAHAFSKQAAESIKKAGGSAEVITNVIS